MLPVSLVEELRRQIDMVQLQHRKDLAEGYGEVWLPHALGVKKPGASRELGWQYVFPAARRSKDPRDPAAKERRHHVDESVPQRAVKTALKLAKVRKAGTCHCRSGGYAICAPRRLANGALRHAFLPALLCHAPAGSWL